MDSGGRLRVFISYARSDCSPLAEDLLAGLEAAGLEAFLDRHDIAAGEVWEARLADLLQKADTVVAVLSPAFVASPRCEWELQRAAELSKRVIPVIGLEVTEAATPEALKRLNYIYFSKGHAFGASLRTLTTALRTDVQWIREHTRLGELAARWYHQSKADALLLRGSELERAKAWLASWTPNAPEPTTLHREFVNDSEAAEHARNNEERKKLDAIAVAQADREKALRSMRDGNRTWAIGLGVMALVIFGGTYYAWEQITVGNVKLADAQYANRLLTSQVELFETERGLKELLDSDAAQEKAATGAVSAETAKAQLEQNNRLGEASRSVTQAAEKAKIDVSVPINIDVFYCTGAGQEENTIQAEAVASQLRMEQANASGKLAFRVGRLRERAWTNSPDLGGFIVADEVRGEPDESALVASLASFINTSDLTPVGMRQTSGTAGTPYYLSVFFCTGQVTPASSQAGATTP
jgi:hypothetical protein